MSDIPDRVVESAERMSAYVGVEERYFDADGKPSTPAGAKYLIVGNYYGSAIYAVEGLVKRLEGFH